MQAVGAGASGNPRVARDQRRGTSLLDHRHQRLGMLLEQAVLEPVLRQDHRGDVAAAQRVLQHRPARRRYRRPRARSGPGGSGFQFQSSNYPFRLNSLRESAGRSRHVSVKADRPVARNGSIARMSIDPSLYLAAVPAVILVGLTKGGMGEALALMGVPILAMVVPPVQAAAILLPILIVSDVVSLWMWRQHNDRANPAVPAAGRHRRHCARLGDVGLCAARRAAPDHRRHHHLLRAALFPRPMADPARHRHSAQAAARRSRPPSLARSPDTAASSRMPAARRSRSTPCR